MTAKVLMELGHPNDRFGILLGQWLLIIRHFLRVHGDVGGTSMMQGVLIASNGIIVLLNGFVHGSQCRPHPAIIGATLSVGADPSTTHRNTVAR